MELIVTYFCDIVRCIQSSGLIDQSNGAWALGRPSLLEIALAFECLALPFVDFNWR
jgi:hypothetical protein